MLPICNFLETCNFQSLSFLYYFNEIRCFCQRIVSPGIQPRKTSSEQSHPQFTIFKELLVNRSYFQFTSSRWFYISSHIHNLIRIKIQSDNCIVRFRRCGFFFNTQRITVFIKVNDTITLRIIHIIAKHCSLLLLLRIADRICEHSWKALSIKDIVTKNEANWIAADKIATDDESLCKSVWWRLFSEREFDSEIGTVTQQPSESRQILRCRYNQYLFYPG